MLLTQRTNLLLNESDYARLKDLSKKNNRSVGELIRFAIKKTFVGDMSVSSILKRIDKLSKNANTKGINYKQLVEDGRK